MDYMVRNEQGLEFTHTTEVYQGYEIFQAVDFNWSDDWNTYTVYNEQQEVMERVFNPTRTNPIILGRLQ